MNFCIIVSPILSAKSSSDQKKSLPLILILITGLDHPSCHASDLCCAALSTTSPAVNIAGTLSFPAAHFTTPPSAYHCASIVLPPCAPCPAIPPCANLPSASVGINGMLMPHMLFAADISLLKALIALFINHSIVATMPLKMLFAMPSSPENIEEKAAATASLALTNASLIHVTPALKIDLMFVHSVLATPTIAIPIFAKNVRIIVSQSSHANLMLSTNH